MQKKIRVAIVGVTGYSGNELLKILSRHPLADIKFLCSSSQDGQSLFDLNHSFLSLKGKIPEILIDPEELDYSQIDCLFTATPNGVSSKLAKKALENNVRLIDLAGDFRFSDRDIFETWYSPLKAADKNLLSEAVYGLTEFNRENIKNAKILANPGCYVTAASLSVIPLVREKLIDIEQVVIIDAKSGSSGAGKKTEEGLMFSELDENFRAYNVLKHRHMPEIQQNIKIFTGADTKIKFTPHLLPIKRGILCTVYAQPSKVLLKEDKKSRNRILNDCFEKAYETEYFVRPVKNLPSIADVAHSNMCHIYSCYDEHTDLIVCISVIDNLLKGASGQAVQNFNSMFSFDETLSIN